MPKLANQHVMPEKPKANTDSRLYLFFALALFFTDCALFCPHEMAMEYVVYSSGYEQKISTVLVYVVAAIATHYQYGRGQFVADENYARHRRFWLLIALLPLVTVQINFVMLTLLGNLDINGHVENLYTFGFYGYEDLDYYTDEPPFKPGYWHKTAIWTLFVLTATWGPALHQHHTDNGIGGILLLMADVCALVYLLFYLTLPPASPVLLFVGAASVTIIGMVILLKSTSCQHLKQLARDILYEFSFWLNFVSLALVVGVFFKL
ncbi:MAG: hypothetical protein ABL903_19885 [Methylococcales bacterium]